VNTLLPTASQAPLWRRLLIRGGKHFLRWSGQFQAKHSLVPTTPVIDNKEFDWVPRLEAAWPEIRAELDHLLEHPEDIPAFHQLSPDQKRISKGDNWKTFGFYIYSKRVDENCAVCPNTAAALDGIPGMRTAMFSILKPQYRIAACSAVAIAVDGTAFEVCQGDRTGTTEPEFVSICRETRRAA